MLEIDYGIVNQPNELSPGVKAITPEERERVESQIGKAVRLFNQMGKSFYLAGGLSLEYTQGGLKRQHKDMDFVMNYEDWGDISRFLKENEYNPFQRTLSSDGQLDPNLREVRYYNGRSGSNGPSGFEAFFLREDAYDHDIVHSALFDMPIPKSYFDHAQEVVIDGEKVRLTPKLVEINNKMYFADGKTQPKDRYDLQMVTSALSSEEVDNLYDLWQQTHIYVPQRFLRCYEENRQMFLTPLSHRPTFSA